MPSIGETLREARMRQRLDIADVETRTKIRAKYLRALENEEFGMLPGPTFVKTFLRTYAEMLGLDPHVLVEAYRANYEGEEELDLQPLGPTTGARRDRRAYGGRRGIGPGSLALLALVGVIAVLVTIGLLSDDSGGEGQTVRTETTPTETEPAPPPEPPKPRRVTLRVVPATPTYVCVDRGPGTPVLFENTIESRQTWRGRRLRVLLGKTDVRLVANGKQVEVPPGANPVGFAFTPRRSRQIPVGGRPCE